MLEQVQNAVGAEPRRNQELACLDRIGRAQDAREGAKRSRATANRARLVELAGDAREAGALLDDDCL